MSASRRPTAGPAPAAPQRHVWLLAAVLVACSLWTIYAELPRVRPSEVLWDFGSFVASGRAAAEGLNPYGIYPLTLRVELHGFETWNPNLNPPISALLFQIFDWTDPHAAFRIWRWISLAFYAATIGLLVYRFRGWSAPGIAIFAIGLAGFWDTLLLGQIYLPLVFCAVAAWLILERGASLGAAILIGLVIAMKPNFLVWPALLFLAGDRRPALIAVGTAALVSAIPLVLYGPEIYRQWLALVASDEERAFFLTNASLAGLAARAGVPKLGIVLSLALLAGLAAWAFWRRPDRMRASAFGLLAALMASPLGWIHYTLFLLPVLLTHARRPAMLVVMGLLTVPVPFIIDQFGKPAWMQFTVGSLYGWALVLCLSVLIWDEWRQPRRGTVGMAPSAVPA